MRFGRLRVRDSSLGLMQLLVGTIRAYPIHCDDDDEPDTRESLS